MLKTNTPSSLLPTTIAAHSLTTSEEIILSLQTAIDQTECYIYIKDIAGRYIYVNHKVQELFNAKNEDIIGKDDSHFFHIELVNDLRLNDRRVLDQGESIEQEEITVVKSTGENRIYWAVKKPIKNSSGQIIGLCGVSTDITDRKRAEELLKESSELLKESQTIAGLGTYILDINSGIWKSSEILDQIFGIEESYLHTLDGWEALIYSKDRAMMRDYFFSEVVGHCKRFDHEYRVTRQNDQAVRWMHGLGKLVFDKNGRPIKMHGTIQDITERKIAEISLRESETFLRLSQAVGGIGSWEADLINNKQTWSENSTRLLGFPALMSPSWDDFLALVHPEDRQHLIDATQAHLEFDSKYDIEFRIIDQSGNIRWMRSIGQAERDEHGKPTIMRGIGQDITELKQREVVKQQVDLLLNLLTRRERDVLELVLAGFHNKDIALQLKISKRTVENHRTRIHTKTGVDSLFKLSQISAKLGGVMADIK